MLDRLPFLVGLRYVRAKRRNHFISFISLTSMLGLALGVAVLILVLSVMKVSITSCAPECWAWCRIRVSSSGRHARLERRWPSG